MRGLALVLAFSCVAPRATAQLPAVTSTFRDGPEARLAAVLGAYPQRHAAEITTAALSADGATLVTAGGERHLKLWDTGSGEELATLPVIRGRIYGLGFTPDGGSIFVGTSLGIVTWWSVATRGPQRSVVHGAPVLVTCNAGEKRLLSVARDRSLKLWGGTSDPLATAVLPPGAPPLACAAVAGGARVIFGDGTVIEITSRGAVTPLAAAAGPVDAATFVRDGGTVIAAAGGVLSALDLAGDATPRELARDLGKVVAVAASGDGARVVVAAAERRVTALDTRSGKRIVDGIEAASAELTAVAVSADGKIAVTASRDSSFERWDLETGRRLPRAAGRPITALVFPDDEHVLAAGPAGLVERHAVAGGAVQRLAAAAGPIYALAAAGDRYLAACDPQPRKAPRQLVPGVAVALSPDGKLTLTGSADGHLRLWHGARRLLDERTPRGVVAVAFAPDGRFAGGVDDSGRLTLLDAVAHKVAARVAAHEGPALALAFLPDSTVVTGGDDHRVRRWDRGGHKVGELEVGSAVTAIAASREGRVIIAERDGLLHPWQADVGRRGAAIDLRPSDDTPLAVAFAPDGRFAVGTRRGVILVFE